MGRDESGTLRRLREHRKVRLEPLLSRYGGRLVKLTGDGALAEFASAVDALSAAIEFQQAMARCQPGPARGHRPRVPYGPALGDLIVDGDDLYGDGVNVAARLEAEAPPGGIVISRNVHDAVAGRLKATFDDLGGLSLKNIERPVQAFEVKWDPAEWRPPSAAPAATSIGSVPPGADVPLTLPDKPSIAVLPFPNMSGDPEQEYFADGMTEDIITELSRFRSLFVIARNSSFSYKGKSPDIRQVGRELGVRYVLEGSIRKSSNRIRVTGQLIDTLTGNHIWAERYDRVLEDIFAVQEELTRAIVGAIAPQIDSTEQSKAVRRRPATSQPTKSPFGHGLTHWKDMTRRMARLSTSRFGRRKRRCRSTKTACWPCMRLRVLTEMLWSFSWRRIGSTPFGRGRGPFRARSSSTARTRLATHCGAHRDAERPVGSLSGRARRRAPRSRDEPQRSDCAALSWGIGSRAW